MDKDTARALLGSPKGRKPSEIGEAVDVLRPEYRSYNSMARDFPDIAGSTMNRRHNIFQLPKGIRWKIDEGEIPIKQGEHITRLKNKHDQWVLAFAIVDENLEEEACYNVVNRVLTHNDSIRDALKAAASVECDKVAQLLLPLGFDDRLAIAQHAWNRKQELQDFCYDRIHQIHDPLSGEFVCECHVLLSQLDEAKSQILEILESYRSNLNQLIQTIK